MRAKGSVVVGFCFLLMLAGCGQSNSNTTPSTPLTAAAYYTGTLQSGTTAYPFEGFVLPNGQMYGMYTTVNPFGAVTIAGMIAGEGASDNGVFTVTSLTEYGSDANVAYTGTLSGSYNGKTLNASITTGTGTMTLTAASLAGFDMNRQPLPIDGTWNGVNLWGDARIFGPPFRISAAQFSSGYMSVVGSAITEDCLYSGKFTAQSQNYYTVSTTIAAAPQQSCTQAGQTVQGVAVTTFMPSGKQHLLVFATTANQAEVFVADE